MGVSPQRSAWRSSTAASWVSDVAGTAPARVSAWASDSANSLRASTDTTFTGPRSGGSTSASRSWKPQADRASARTIIKRERVIGEVWTRRPKAASRPGCHAEPRRLQRHPPATPGVPPRLTRGTSARAPVSAASAGDDVDDLARHHDHLAHALAFEEPRHARFGQRQPLRLVL